MQSNKSKAIFPGYTETNKYKLPPFLMIRAGVLRPIIPAIIGAGLTGLMLTNENYKMGKCGEFLLSASILVFATCACWGKYAVEHKKNQMKERANNINDAAKIYIRDGVLKINSDDKFNLLVLQNIAKHNPGIFDKFMQNPNSITDKKIAENILFGHLKSHPVDAQKILDVFNIETMPNKLRRRATIYANRIKSR